MPDLSTPDRSLTLNARFRGEDADGREVPLLDPVVLRLRRQFDPLDAATLNALITESGSGLDAHARRFLPVLVIGGGLLGLILLIQVVDYTVQGRAADVLNARNIAIVNVGFFAWVFWARSRRNRAPRVQKAMLRHGRCPHCGYDLGHADAADDEGITACTECGCRWRVTSPRG